MDQKSAFRNSALRFDPSFSRLHGQALGIQRWSTEGRMRLELPTLRFIFSFLLTVFRGTITWYVGLKAAGSDDWLLCLRKLRKKNNENGIKAVCTQNVSRCIVPLTWAVCTKFVPSSRGLMCVCHLLWPLILPLVYVRPWHFGLSPLSGILDACRMLKHVEKPPFGSISLTHWPAASNWKCFSISFQNPLA